MKQSILKLLFVATICSLVLIACAPQSPTPVGGGGDQPTAQNTEVSDPATPVPDTGETLPGLAESWTVSEDGLDYVFQLKTGAVFSDNTPVNADAVAANFNRWFDPNDPARGSGSYEAWATAFGGFKGEKDEAGLPKSSFDGIEKVDNFTVLIHLNRPFADLLTVLAQPDFAIVSPASFNK